MRNLTLFALALIWILAAGPAAFAQTTDQEFDDGSGITLTALNDAQVLNVALLGRVWGFLKYHHPRVAAGELHWDYELFRVLPDVLEAADTRAGQHIIADWLEQIGVPESCDPCARKPRNLHLKAPIDWIEDDDLLGSRLARYLQQVHVNRYAGGDHFYISQHPSVGNPIFDAELWYSQHETPDTGYRILALLRMWNIVEYWSPYRDLLDDDWRLVLRQELPRVVGASTWESYRLSIMAFVARIRDTHTNLWSSLSVRPPRGTCRWPVILRFIVHQPTVTGFLNEDGKAMGLRLGDVVESIDGVPVDRLIADWTPYYGASNEPTRQRDMASSMTNGACGESTLGIRRDGTSLIITGERQPGLDEPFVHDRPGETFQLLSDDIAYLKLSSIKSRDIDDYLARAAGTRGLVIDIRNYPNEFVVFDLGRHLVPETTTFARFTVGDLQNPGAFVWRPRRPSLTPSSPTYDGKVAILVDEVSQSQAEYTTMAFRAVPGAVVVGSTTAGADGNVSWIPLPGGLRTLISGIGVFYPDKTPTQRVGIVPDIEVRPSVAGIRAGRDEVLESALRHLLGADFDEATLRRMAASGELLTRPIQPAVRVETPSSALMSWTAQSATPTFFEVSGRVNGGPWEFLATTGIGAESALLTGLEAAARYEVRVRACSDTGVSPWSPKRRLRMPRRLQAPNPLRASILSASRIRLTWNDRSNGEEAFDIEVLIDDAESWQAVESVGAGTRNLVLSGLVPETSYLYRVRARAEGALSAWSSRRVTLPAELARPDGVASTVLTPSRILLEWTDHSDGEELFEIDYRLGAGTWQDLAEVDAGVERMVVAQLTAGTTLRFRIRARSEGGLSDWSPLYRIDLPAELVRPGAIQAEVLSPTSVRLTWSDHSDGEDFFEVEAKADSQGWAAAGTVEAGGESLVLTGLMAGSSYAFRVRARSSSGLSEWRQIRVTLSSN